MSDPLDGLGQVAGEVLQRMVRDLLGRRSGGHLLEGQLDEVELRLCLALRGQRSDPAVFARELRASLEGWIDDAIQHAAAFRPGHAFCHRCGQAACDHSEPPSGRHVFIGYGPTGLPRWEDFAQHCLELRHPLVGALYDDPPAFLTLIQGGGALRGGLLGAFEATGYALLGQVLAGFYPIRPRQDEGRGVLALSLQIGASWLRDGRMRLGLNLIGRTPGGGPLDLLWERQDDLPWRTAVLWAQSALGTVQGAAPGRTGPVRRPQAQGVVEARVDGILRGLARRLERDRRARSRRTSHAELRHASGERPTRKAAEDGRAARPDAILVDERSGARVVLGERGRTHFFSPDGRLISSVRYSRDAIERKRKLGLWREAADDEVRDLGQRLGWDDAQAKGDVPRL